MTPDQIDAHLAQEFAGLFKVNGECWEYTGPDFVHGYGRIKRDGQKVLLSRYVLALKLGRPLTLNALHTCTNPPCFRAAHLYEGSQLDNAADRDRDGNTAVGERNGRSRLTAVQVIAMRQAYANGTSARALGERYGIALRSVQAIVRGDWWKSVPLVSRGER